MGLLLSLLIVWVPEHVRAAVHIDVYIDTCSQRMHDFPAMMQ